MRNARMSCIGLVLAGLLPVSLAVAPSASAVATLQLYVDPDGTGTQCTDADPCPTIQAAVDVAAATPAVVHLAPKPLPGGAVVAAGQQVTIVGNGSATDAPVVGGGFRNEGTLRLTRIRSTGGIGQLDGDLLVTDSSLGSGGYGLRVSGGTARVEHSDLDWDPSFTDFAVELVAGRLEFDSVQTGPLVQHGGRLSARALRSFYATISGGRIDATASAFDRTVSLSGDAQASFHATVLGFGIVVEGSGASAVLAQSTVGTFNGLRVSDGGRLAMAATVVNGGGTNCQGTITDGGYNSSSDGTCAFSEPTSTNDAPNYQLRDSGPINPLDGGLSPLPDSSLVDAIPVGATATFDPSIALCRPGDRDDRGQPRPVTGRCDIGAVELGEVVLDVSVDRTPIVWDRPAHIHTQVSLADGTIPQPVDGTLFVGVEAAPECLLHRQISSIGTYSCAAVPEPGTRRVVASFTPTGPLKPVTATTRLTVAKAPRRLGIAATSTVRRGSTATVRVHAINAATSDPLRFDVIDLWLRTATRDWYRAKRFTLDKDGRAVYTFTPGQNVAYQWRMTGNEFYLAGRSPTAHTTVR